MYTLYMHFNRVNGKKYIGITCKSLNSRFGKDGSGYKRSTHFWNAIQKYGWCNFEHRILRTGLTEDEAKDLEKKYISAFQSNDPRYGYNILEGGQGGPLPQETKDKLSESHKGKPSGMKDKHHSKETKQKIAATRRGKHLSEKTREKIAAALRGKPNGMKDKHHSDETKEKMAAARRGNKNATKKVLCVETGVAYESLTACAESFGASISYLSASIKQGWKCKGFHFEYYDIDEGD